MQGLGILPVTDWAKMAAGAGQMFARMGALVSGTLSPSELTDEELKVAESVAAEAGPEGEALLAQVQTEIEKREAAKRRKKWLIVGGVALVTAAAVGVGVWMARR
jgi:hypothetical protein